MSAPTLRETLREHQDATETSDSEMLRVLCDVLDELEADDGSELCEEILLRLSDRLQRAPGDCG